MGAVTALRAAGVGLGCMEPVKLAPGTQMPGMSYCQWKVTFREGEEIDTMR